MASQPVAAERIVVRNGRIVFEVRCAPGARATTPALAAAAAAHYPHLPDHACVNEAGRTFAAVMHDTPLPHLLEHLIIDIQTRDAASSPSATFVGTSEWLDESAGLARVQVSFADDLAALQAFREALRFVNEAVVL